MPIVGTANDVEATNTDENINVSGDIYQNIAIKTGKNDKQISVIDNNTKYTDLIIDNVSDDDQSGGQNFQQSGAKRRNMKKQPKKIKTKKKSRKYASYCKTNTWLWEQAFKADSCTKG